jgi:hypothetical protein
MIRSRFMTSILKLPMYEIIACAVLQCNIHPAFRDPKLAAQPGRKSRRHQMLWERSIKQPDQCD